MGDIEYHDMKVAEAREQGKEEGRQEAIGEGGDLNIGIFLIIILIAFAAICSEYENGSGADKNTARVHTVTDSSARSLPADISNYIAPDGVRFYKYTGSGGETYVRHHYEPTGQISKQGYYRSDTGEYVLVDISYYTDNGQNMCRWSIYYCGSGGRSTAASGTDPIDVADISSYNCQAALTQTLSAHGFDIVTHNDYGYYGDEISRDSAFSIIGYSA
jgi:hypothetical protein